MRPSRRTRARGTSAERTALASLLPLHGSAEDDRAWVALHISGQQADGAGSSRNLLQSPSELEHHGRAVKGCVSVLQDLACLIHHRPRLHAGLAEIRREPRDVAVEASGQL